MVDMSVLFGIAVLLARPASAAERAVLCLVVLRPIWAGKRA
jgi:hypothetical protein